jgi:cell wall-associated NlpC family hydrolase
MPPSLRSRLLAFAIAAIGFACTAPTATARLDGPPKREPPKPTIGERAAKVALRAVGVPYRWGGTSRQGLDCSGLVVVAFKDAYGVTPPRTTQVQVGWSQLRPITGKAAPGDLLFWPRTSSPSHVGIAVSPTHVIHAARPGTRVAVVPIMHAFSVGTPPAVYRYTGR